MANANTKNLNESYYQVIFNTYTTYIDSFH